MKKAKRANEGNLKIEYRVTKRRKKTKKSKMNSNLDTIFDPAQMAN